MFSNLKKIFILFISISSFSQNSLTLIDSLLIQKFDKINAPGANILISKNDKILYNKSFGLANIELNVPLNTNHVFEIGSMTKQFTAIATLILIEQGKLSLEDNLTKFLPDYPNGNNITVQHLLNHTSGIKNFTSIKGLHKIAHKNLTPIELINFFKDTPIDFAPGNQFKYTNSGYILLGYIIEKISGLRYANFIKKNIFNKLQMTSSYYASRSKLIKNRASGYHHKTVYRNNRKIHPSIPYASGALMSTVNDLFIWNKAIKNHTLISKETTAKVFSKQQLNNGKLINYGLGWHIKNINDLLSYEHGGAIFGFKSMGVYIPKEDIYIVILSNCDCNSPTKITREIAKILSNTNTIN